MKVFGHILTLLTPQEQRRGLLVLAAAITMAMVETAGVASIMPFLAVLGNPGLIESNSWFAWLYHLGGFATPDDFMFALGLLALSMVLISALVRLSGQYAIQRFSNMRRYSISMRMIKGYLSQPYIYFLNRNSADLIARALSNVDAVIEGCILSAMQVVSYSMIVILLVTLLIMIDPFMVTVVFAVMGSFYTILYLSSQNLLRRIGSDRSKANRERFTVAAEMFSGIKEIKLSGLEAVFAERFRSPALRFARHRTTSDVVSLLPRYFIEAVAFGGILILALMLLRTHGNLGDVLPILGVYAFAGYRLLPAMQNMYAAIVNLRFNMPVVEMILADLPPTRSTGLKAGASGSLVLRKNIRFEGVNFRYPGAAAPIFSSLDMEIHAGESVGLVGETGSGKSTAVDLLFGLLSPNQGRILIDDQPLTDANRRAWQKNLGYVPQSIFLADTTIAENIAFGVEPKMIDRSAVERAAKIANIHDFITKNLPAGYDTEIGERGIRLSGGQRQRIGIARALYHDPAVLVFDEATSALDNETEAAVMEAINALQGKKTMVIIAHRKETVRKCDRILQLRNGKITNANFDN